MKPRRQHFCRNLAVAALFLGVAFQASALDPSKTLTQYAHRIWGQEEGLFQPTIYSILQTRDGFLWLGTQDSLIRFDGARFRDFGGAGTFQHSLIRALLEDNHGNLWAASVGSGVVKLTPDGAVKRYTTKEGLPSDNVFCVASTPKIESGCARTRGWRVWITGDFAYSQPPTACHQTRFDRHAKRVTVPDGLPVWTSA
jgi:ligand-binding sensor domain-containing protein